MRGARDVVWIGMLAVVVGGCRDMGLNNNLPFDEARDRVGSTVVQVATYGAPDQPRPAAPPPALIGNQQWVPAGVTHRIPEHALRPVGGATGAALSALATDEPPHAILFSRQPSGVWLEYRPVY